MYCDTWPPQDDLKSTFESQSTTGSLPFLEEVVPFRGRAHCVSETTQALPDQHKRMKASILQKLSVLFIWKRAFCILESSWPQAHQPRGYTMSSVLQKEANVWCTWSSEYSTVTSILPPTQLPSRSNACTLGAWKTHPKIVWPWAKTASEVAHLISHCQLAQYLTSVEMAVCWLDSLVKNVSTAPFNNLECPLEKAKLMWFFYLKKLRNIAAANSIITLSCQQQFNIFFSPEGYNTFAPWGSFFSLHLKTVPQTLPLFITARSPAEIGTFVLL